MVTAAQIPGWMAGEYPFSPHTFLTTDGVRLSYLDEGPRSAEAVLMLHGNPTWSYYFRHLVPALAGRVRCVVPDHVGMGASDKPARRDYSLAARIADVLALVAHLELRKIHLVVHDWGGAIGLGFALRFRGEIGRVTLLNTAAFTSEQLPARIALCRTPLLGPLLVRGANGFAWPATWMAMHRRSLTREERRAYLWPYDSWASRVGVNAFVRDIPMSPAHPSWATLQGIESGLARFRGHEVMAVWGLRDFCFSRVFLDRWRDFLPDLQVHALEDAGHYVLEDAREETIPLITRFLDRS